MHLAGGAIIFHVGKGFMGGGEMGEGKGGFLISEILFLLSYLNGCVRSLLCSRK